MINKEELAQALQVYDLEKLQLRIEVNALDIQEESMRKQADKVNEARQKIRNILGRIQGQDLTDQEIKLVRELL